MDADAVAEELGRHYVAGHLEAAELDERLGTAYGDDSGTALAGLPVLERTAPAPEGRRAGWWRFRHGEVKTANAGWVPTTERFVDPTTQRVMRVWNDPATRRRHYVPEA